MPAPKLALQIQALDSRIASQELQRDQAKTDLDRVAELQKRGVSTQTQLDQARTNLDVAERNLTANPSGPRRDRKIGVMLPCNVIVQQHADGCVEVAAIDPAAAMQSVGNPALTGGSPQRRATSWSARWRTCNLISTTRRPMNGEVAGWRKLGKASTQSSARSRSAGDQFATEPVAKP